MSHNRNNPFSSDYVSTLKIDHRDTKYKRPVLNQPPVNSRVNLAPAPTMKGFERFKQLSQTSI